MYLCRQHTLGISKTQVPNSLDSWRQPLHLGQQSDTPTVFATCASLLLRALTKIRFLLGVFHVNTFPPLRVAVLYVTTLPLLRAGVLFKSVALISCVSGVIDWCFFHWCVRVSFDVNVACSSCWGYSLINTLEFLLLHKKESSSFVEGLLDVVLITP